MLIRVVDYRGYSINAWGEGTAWTVSIAAADARLRSSRPADPHFTAPNLDSGLDEALQRIAGRDLPPARHGEPSPGYAALCAPWLFR